MEKKRTQRFLLFVNKWIPTGTVVPYGLAFTYQSLIYFITQLFVKNIPTHNIETSWDRAIPFLPSFIYIYLGCYVFWILNVLLSGDVSKRHFYKIVTTSIICVTISGAIFIIYPVTIERPQFAVTGANTFLVSFLYSIDEPVNLLPSLHCLSSWLCFIAVRRQKVIPYRYRVFTLVYTVLICISTQVLKQHYISDLVVGILLVELIWYMVNHTRFYLYTFMFFEKINKSLKISWRLTMFPIKSWKK